MTEIASPSADTAPLTPHQLLLPSLAAMAQDLLPLLALSEPQHALHAHQLLQQMAQAVQVLQMDSLAKLMQAMQAPLRQWSAHQPPAEKTQELLQLAGSDLLGCLQQLASTGSHASAELFTSYRALTRLGGKDTAHPADLWDNAWPMPHIPAPTDITPTPPSATLRSLLDQHVLALLQSSNPAYCTDLHAASLGLAAHARDATWWQLCGAWLQGLEYGLLELDIYAKRLASRWLAYYASFAKGEETPPPALQRDALFFCVQAIETAAQRQQPLPDSLALVLRCSQTIPEIPATPPVLSPAPAALQPALAPALPAFEAAVEIQPTNALVQGLASSTKIEPDLDFLQAAEPLSVQLENQLGAWRRSSDSPLPTETAAQASELARLAWAAGCTEIAALAQLLQRCLLRLPGTSADAAQRQNCQYASEEVRRLLHQFAAGFMRRAHPQVLQTLEQMLAQLPEPPPASASEMAADRAEDTTPTSTPSASDSGGIVLDFPDDPADADTGTDTVTATPPPASGPAATAPLPASVPVHTPVLDAQHFRILEEEMQSAWPLLQNALQQWLRQPQDDSARQIVLRSLHTLKGSARLAGAMAWASQVHAMESLALEATLQAGPSGPDCLPAPLEALRMAFVALQQEMDVRYPERQASALQHSPLQAVARHAQALWHAQDHGQQAFAANQLSLQEISSGLHKLRAQIKDCAAWADTLMLHGDLDLPYEWHEELHDLVHALNDCTDDLGTAQQQLAHGLQESERTQQQQAEHLRALQHTLLYARLQPLTSVQERLKKCVQLAAQDADKTVELYWQGADTIMDRKVLEVLTPALEHLLRNSVAHGIEGRTQRQAAKKSPTGKILLRLRTQGQQQILSVMDDGAGLDTQAIARKALALGLLGPGELVDSERAAALIVQPGLSTASAVTELAGRGIGMDVVAHTVEQLGGQLSIHSKPGKGCHFDISLPAPPHVEKILALRAGSWRVALPVSQLEDVRRLPEASVHAALAQGLLQEPHQAPLPLYWAGAVWQQSQRSLEAPLDGHYSVLVVRGDTARWGLVVDEVIDTQEATLQAPADLAVPVAGLLGTASLANGQVLQVYAPGPVIAAHESRLISQQAQDSAAQPGAQAPQRPLILLADDSLSVRRLAQHLLQSQGYRVSTAADGLQALQLLDADSETPALLIADIEMPDMDGLELLRRVRATARLEQLPVLMLTAHTAGPVSQKAITLGAQAFLTKPYAPHELLAQVRRYCPTTPA